MKPYHHMNAQTLEREYNPSSCIDDIMVYIDQYAADSAKVRADLRGNLTANVKYGPEARSHMDVFAPKGDGPFPVHVFIHGGYWQELSKDENCFCAPIFLDHNVIFIAFDYTLAPQASLFEIVDQTRRGIISILKNADKFNGDKNNITISGHSAGGHLLAEVLSMNWQNYGYDKCPIKGAMAISGVYDLEPIVSTTVNDALHMTVEDAIKLSPLHHLPTNACPIAFTVGENETAEFHRQTEEYMNACTENGIKTAYLDMPVFNHFDIILELNNKNSPLFQTILNQIRS